MEHQLYNNEKKHYFTFTGWCFHEEGTPQMI